MSASKEMNPDESATNVVAKVRASISRVYSNVFVGQPKSILDHNSHTLTYGNSQDYELVRYVACGTFSKVFEGVVPKTGQKCMVKMLKPVTPERVKREVRLLLYLKGGPNIIQLMDVVQNPSSKITSLIFEFVQNESPQQLYQSFTDLDIRFYMFELLKALDYMHSKGVMHRDLKPNNVVIDHKTHTLRLIDFGMAELYYPYTKNVLQVATLQYKAPELLIGYKMYDYSVDIWAFGCMLATMAYMKFPFFDGYDPLGQLSVISKVLGTEGLFAYINRYNMQMNPLHKTALGVQKKLTWDSLITSKNCKLASSIYLYDILENTLCYEHSVRMSARDALEHPYFLPIIQGFYP